MLSDDMNLDFMEFTVDQIITVVETETVQIQSYPNPFSDQMTISSDHQIQGVQVYTLTGSLVESVAGGATKIISLGQNLDAGIYLIEIHSGGEIVREKIVKK